MYKNAGSDTFTNATIGAQTTVTGDPLHPGVTHSQVTVDGEEASLEGHATGVGNLIVGDQGFGTLTVTNGGSVSDSTTTIGKETAALTGGTFAVGSLVYAARLDFQAARSNSPATI